MQPQEQFAKAYNQYADAIFRHCCLHVYDRELAKDLMQETFMKAWKYYSGGEGDKIENLKALLYKIATNLIIDHSRRPLSKRTDSLEDLMESGFEPGGHAKDDSEHDKLKTELDAKDALKILAYIKEEYREVLILRYFSDLSLKQTAQALEISENLVSVRINRALQELRKYFKKT